MNIIVPSFHDVVDGKIDAIASHVCSIDQWYGRSAATGMLDRGGLLPWQLETSGGYGDFVQISDGSEVNRPSYDIKKIEIVASHGGQKTYLLEFWAGETFGTAALVAEAVYTSKASDVKIEVNSDYVTSGQGIWARCKCLVPTSIDFLICITCAHGETP